LGEEEWNQFADQYYAQIQAQHIPVAADMRAWLEGLDVLPAGRVLDIAGGCGRFTIELARRASFADIVDWSSAMLHNAARNAEDHGMNNIGFIHGDWTKIPLKPADLVFVSELASLRPEDLPFLYSISKRALVVGHCTADRSQVLSRAAKALAIRYVPQGVHAELPATYQQHFASAGIISNGHCFKYQLKGSTTLQTVATALDASVTEVARALNMSGTAADASIPDTHDYEFTYIAVLK
jgi:protein-L-isoaspartate O-methyltransferase